MLRQCFSSGTAADGHTPYKARPSQSWPKITTYNHVHQIFITFCTWFRRGVLCDRGFTYCSFCCKWFIHRIILTFKTLKRFKDYRRCIHISYHILDCVQQKKTTFIMEQPHMWPTLYSQYHSCCCSGNLRSQGISRHGIDQISRNIPSGASEESTCVVSIYRSQPYFTIITISAPSY